MGNRGQAERESAGSYRATIRFLLALVAALVGVVPGWGRVAAEPGVAAASNVSAPVAVNISAIGFACGAPCDYDADAIQCGSLEPPPLGDLSIGQGRIAGSISLSLRSCESGRLRPAVDFVAPSGTPRLNPPFSDGALRSQVDDVVRHFDEFGTPPSGVAQGGLRNHPPGTYGNRGKPGQPSSKLPEQPLGSYTEMDVWPSQGVGSGTRGTERLIFGDGGEVW